MEKLFRLSYTLDSKEFRKVEREVEYKPANKTLIVDTDWNPSGKMQIKISSLMTVDTGRWRPDRLNEIYYQVWCFEGDLPEARKKIFDKISEELALRERATEVMAHNLHYNVVNIVKPIEPKIDLPPSGELRL